MARKIVSPPSKPPQPTDLGHQLLDRIREAPADDAPRLVFADWIAEREPERGEIICVQCALARLPLDAPERPGLEDREHALLSAHGRRWTAGIPAGTKHTFDRGFVGGITDTVTRLVEHGRTIAEQHPITKLEIYRDDSYEQEPIEALGRERWLSSITQLQAELFPPLLESEHLTSVRELVIDRYYEPDPEIASTLHVFQSLTRLERLSCPRSLVPQDLGALLAALASSQLVDLALASDGIDAALVEVLARAAVTERLTSLDLSFNPLRDEGVRALATLPCRLRSLDLSRSIGELAAINMLLAATCTSELASLALDLHYFDYEEPETGLVEVDPDELRAFGESALASRAGSLTMRHVLGGDEGIHALFRAHAPLRDLNLSDCDWYDGDMTLLAAAPFADTLVRLSLRNAGADDADMAVLAASGRFTHLRELDVIGNVGAAGAKHLASARSLARLRRLRLGGQPITSAAALAVLEGPWSLAELELDECDLRPDAIRALADSPRLARLEKLDVGSNPALKGRALLPLAESQHLSARCEVSYTGVYEVDAVVDQAFAARRT